MTFLSAPSRLVPLPAAILAALLGSACPPVPAAAEAVLAGLGAEQVTDDDLRRETERMRAADPGRRLGEEEIERIFRRLVETRLLAAAAREEGLDRSPEVQRDITRLIAARYQEQKLEPRLRDLTAGEEELRAYWAGHPGEFTRPEQVRGAVISVSVSPKAPPETRAAARARAEEARRAAVRDLPAGTPGFGPVAATFSDDQPTRYRGGDTGWLGAGDQVRWGEAVSGALASLKEPGEISPVMEGPQGFFLVRLIERKAALTLPLDEVREAVRRKVLGAKREEAVRGFFRELENRGRLSVDEGLLAETARRLADVGTGGGSPPPLPAR